jgi:hypothetical protein
MQVSEQKLPNGNRLPGNASVMVGKVLGCADLFIVLEDFVRFRLFRHSSVVDPPHALDVFGEVAQERRVNWGIVH